MGSTLQRVLLDKTLLDVKQGFEVQVLDKVSFEWWFKRVAFSNVQMAKTYGTLFYEDGGGGSVKRECNNCT